MRIYSTASTEKPDLNDYRDRSGVISVDSLMVEVKVKDARIRFGHLDLLVTPIAGSGERWIEQHRVTLEPVTAAFPVGTYEV
jgi:hypothetical protein